MFLADIQNGKIINGIANDGIFDIYAVFTKPDGSEMVSPLAAYRPGEPVTFSVENREGTITVSVDAVSVTETVKDCEGAYFKFGNYLQAQDAITSVQETDHTKYEEFYSSRNITKDEVVFRNYRYSTW